MAIDRRKAPSDEGERREWEPLLKIRYKKRRGFETRSMRWVYRLLYPYFHCRVTLPRTLRDSDEPVVFIANHYNIFGPVSFVLSMPVVSRIWMNEELMTRESAAVGLRSGLKKLLPFLTESQVGRISDKVAGLAVRVLTRFGVIPVNREQPSRLISTMRQSMEALEAGENLLIFPETGYPEYSLTSVTPFFSGFAMLGRLFYRKTGKVLRFVPCYIDEQHHQIRLGETVSWDPEADPREETERVSDALNLRIREMAAVNRGLEREETRPVQQTILIFCNLIRTLLLIPFIVMLGIADRRMILLLYCLSQGLRVLFNAAGSTYASSNRLSFLYSHAVGILTDLAGLLWLTNETASIGWVALGLGLNGLMILVSNIFTFFRYRRCAGLNYFDTLSANLLCVLCLQQLLRIRLNPLGFFILSLAILIFLTCSAGFALVFNARLGLTETEETD